jgi:hypothetical protein
MVTPITSPLAARRRAVLVNPPGTRAQRRLYWYAPLQGTLHTVRGFFVLRTIPVDNHTCEDNIFLRRHLLLRRRLRARQRPARRAGPRRGQRRARAHRGPHRAAPATNGAPAYTMDKHVFHTNGVSGISSSWRVYSEAAEPRPDVVKMLTMPWVHDSLYSITIFDIPVLCIPHPQIRRRHAVDRGIRRRTA